MNQLFLVGGQSKIPVLVVFSVLLAVACMALFLRYRVKTKPTGISTGLKEQPEGFHEPYTGGERFTDVLDTVRCYVEAEGYFLYIMDQKNGEYKLESVLYKQKEIKGPLQVGYGRLFPYGKQEYDPPLTLPIENADTLSLIKEGRNSILQISMVNSLSIIRVLAPQRHSIIKDSGFIQMTDQLGEVLKNILTERDLPIPEESVPHAVFHENSTDNILQLIKLSSCSDAVIFFSITNHYCESIMSVDLEPDTKEQLYMDEKLTVMMDELADMGVTVVDSDTKEFQYIPSYMTAAYSVYAFLRYEAGILVLCYKNSLKQTYLKDYRLRFMKLLTMKLNEGNTIYIKDTEKQNYLRGLIEIAKLIDDVAPDTVGYSELMSGYTAILCRETNVDESKSISYGHAASLSNIGLVALPEELWSKAGIYSMEEYRSIQDHALYGAQIVRLLLTDTIVEQCIRYHHEQPDGEGYPEGLHMTDIPEGARMLRVVQYYISMFKGRPYRSPYSFDRCLNELRKQAGIAIDPAYTYALIDWLNKKRSNPIYKGKPLGRCYEIRCVSEKICRTCPAYKRTDKFCWEFETNNCAAHGNTCPTCSIYTEFIFRNVDNKKKDEKDIDHEQKK